jgi:Aspartyl protease
MPCISGTYNPTVGPLLQVAVLPAIADPQVLAAPALSLHLYTALLDTGASITCISNKVVTDVKLAPTGKTQMTGSTGNSPVNTYQFNVGFLFNPIQNPSGQISGQLNLHFVDGCEFSNTGLGFDILMGRDILCKGHLSLSFDGHFILSF